MAKVNVLGDAVVITSAVRLADIQLIEKYRPEALILKGGEDGKEQLFRISTGDVGCINKYGATFSGATRDDDKFATLTMPAIIEGDEKLAEAVADAIGGPLMMLNQLEAQLPEVVEAIADEKAAIMAAITIA